MTTGKLPEGYYIYSIPKKTVNYRGMPDLTPNLDCSIFVDILAIL